MVAYSEVLNSNNSLLSPGSGPTALFVGATSGIGLGTLRALTKHTSTPTIYIVGRSASALKTLIEHDLEPLNKDATFIPIPVDDLTLIKNVDLATAVLTGANGPKHLDLLFMSAGFLTLAGRDESVEGLDKITSIRFYARMRFFNNVLPLLKKAPSPRVISVLAGGKEGKLWADDLALKEHYSVAAAADASGSLNTLFMEEAAKQPGNEKIVFVHLFPGFVRGTSLFTTDHWGPVAKFLIGWIVMPLLRPFTYTVEEAGERVLFAGTSGRFRRLDDGANAEGTLVQHGSNGQLGSGVYILHSDSSTAEAPKILKTMREEGMAKKVYEHTLEEWARIEKM